MTNKTFFLYKIMDIDPVYGIVFFFNTLNGMIIFMWLPGVFAGCTNF